MSQIIFITDPSEIWLGVIIKWSKELDQFIIDNERLLENIFQREEDWKLFPKGRILRVTGKLDDNEGIDEFIFHESAIEILDPPWSVE